MTTYSAVVTTDIYCRPGCGARPHAENGRTFELAAAAEAAGFRACLRCRPYRIAGEVPWDAPEPRPICSPGDEFSPAGRSEPVNADADREDPS